VGDPQALYQPGIYPDLWFHWEGKPLILADPALLTPAMLIGQGSDPSPLDFGHAQGRMLDPADSRGRRPVPPQWGPDPRPARPT